MQSSAKIDFSKLLGFDTVADDAAKAVKFEGETIGAKLGAKVGGKVCISPGELASIQRD